MSDRVLISGGNGYIASHMCKYLSAKGHDVFWIDNFSTSPQGQVHQYGKFYPYDIASKDTSALLEEIKPDTVFHYAAKALVPESEANPWLYYEENLKKTLTFLHSCSDAKVSKFIFSSTCATFGVPKTKTLAEDHPQNPINTYGLTKLLMEKAMRDIAEKGYLNILVFRYFNAAGCDPDGELGENHDPETHLIPNLCKAYLNESNESFKIFGTDYDTEDGTCVRDYVHVNDLAESHYLGMKYLNDRKGFYDFNLGSEKGYSVKEVLKCFESITGEKLSVIQEGRREGDPPLLVANSQKALQELNFRTTISLEDCIRDTLNYFKKKNL